MIVMNRFCVLLFIPLFANNLMGQIHDYSYMNKIYNLYRLERDTNNYFTINKGIFDIRANSRVSGDILSEHIKYTNSYFVRNDTLFIGSIGNQTKLKVISDGILLALNDILGYVKKGENLYGDRFHYMSGAVMLLGGEWKNGLKQGSWLFIDESGKQSGLIFKDGIIVNTFKVKMLEPDF
jgi:hypothetical protein